MDLTSIDQKQFPDHNNKATPRKDEIIMDQMVKNQFIMA